MNISWRLAWCNIFLKQTVVTNSTNFADLWACFYAWYENRVVFRTLSRICMWWNVFCKNGFYESFSIKKETQAQVKILWQSSFFINYRCSYTVNFQFCYDYLSHSYQNICNLIGYEDVNIRCICARSAIWQYCTAVQIWGKIQTGWFTKPAWKSTETTCFRLKHSNTFD